MIYNIIGDIHGRTCWKYLVQEEAINVFVGDYFSPYHEISWEEQKQNFLDIINYKTAHPQTILLIGNHDEDHWHLMRSGCCRHDYEHDDEIRQMFEEFADYFQVAYSIENKVLVTHAGVSYVWYEHYKNHILTNTAWNLNCNDPDEIESPYTHEMVPFENPIKYLDMTSPEEAFIALHNKYHKLEGANPVVNFKEGTFIEWKDTLWRYSEASMKFEKYNVSPDEVARFVNSLWEEGKYEAFDFMSNTSNGDYYGDAPTHGPMWIRTGALAASNIFSSTSYVQVFGHTISSEIRLLGGARNLLIMVDCLERKADSLIIDTITNTIKTLNEYKHGQ